MMALVWLMDSAWLKVKQKAIKGFCCNSRYFSHRTSFLARIFRFYIFLLGGGHTHFIRIFEIFNQPRSRPQSFSVILCHDFENCFFEKSINISIHFMPKNEQTVTFTTQIFRLNLNVPKWEHLPIRSTYFLYFQNN